VITGLKIIGSALGILNNEETKRERERKLDVQSRVDEDTKSFEFRDALLYGEKKSVVLL
jgi:hypothetical protein